LCEFLPTKFGEGKGESSWKKKHLIGSRREQKKEGKKKSESKLRIITNKGVLWVQDSTRKLEKRKKEGGSGVFLWGTRGGGGTDHNHEEKS